METLTKLSLKNRPALKLKNDTYQQMFAWLIKSFKTITSASPDQKVKLEDPTGPNGWGEIEI